jgi:anti-anti-sigma factor
MLLSQFPQQSDWPVAKADFRQRPPVAMPAVTSSCVLRPAPVASRLEVTISQSHDGLFVRVKGDALAQCAGALLDGLLTASVQSPAIVTLDLTLLRSISGLAMGVLVTYRRGLVRRGGRVRLAGGLQPVVREALERTKLLDLFETAAGAAAAKGR